MTVHAKERLACGLQHRCSPGSAGYPLEERDTDAGWLCERFSCSDVQRPPPPNFHEPPLIREVPSDFGRPRR